nr:hypothetical protein [Candidatus Phytoplasma sacchari]KAB8122854.1 hypothetical protein F2B49_00470 [Candidatus Phytoplasma sacchari]
MKKLERISIFLLSFISANIFCYISLLIFSILFRHFLFVQKINQISLIILNFILAMTIFLFIFFIFHIFLKKNKKICIIHIEQVKKSLIFILTFLGTIIFWIIFGIINLLISNNFLFFYILINAI